jgi:hypothetical protein
VITGAAATAADAVTTGRTTSGLKAESVEESEEFTEELDRSYTGSSVAKEAGNPGESDPTSGEVTTGRAVVLALPVPAGRAVSLAGSSRGLLSCKDASEPPPRRPTEGPLSEPDVPDEPPRDDRAVEGFSPEPDPAVDAPVREVPGCAGRDARVVFDEAESVEPAEPDVSANAHAGMTHAFRPTPSAIAKAPTRPT